MELFEPTFDLAPYTRTDDNLTEIAFPLGGIGVGCVSLDGRGGLRDWEIYGKPNKGTLFDYTFPAIWVQEEGKAPQRRTVLGPRRKQWLGEGTHFWGYGHGQFSRQMDGIPGFPEIEFSGTYPVARVRFNDPDLPIHVELAAPTPFIPNDVDGSSFPVANLLYRVTNRSDRRVKATLVWSVKNPVGGDPEEGNKAWNRWVEGERYRGILFGNDRLPEDDLEAGEFLLATDWTDVTYTERWSEEVWWDSVRGFWNQFRDTGELGPIEGTNTGLRMPGSLGLKVELAPGESAVLPFAMFWRFPNRDRYWNKEEGGHRWRAHYAVRWPNVQAIAEEFFREQGHLREQTLRFEAAIYDSSLPVELTESIGATASILQSPTVIRLENGEFWAWEGCSPQEGCCEGTCSHVWNYALTHAYLFPEIQRSFLDSAFGFGFRCGKEGEQGAMRFRQPIPMAQETGLWHAASDGQLGQIVQVYRDWRLNGDKEWLRALWPAVKRAMAWSWVQWDRDRDGLVDGDMHNTYDINFQSPNPLTQFFYLAALRACEEIAKDLGEDGSEYRDLYEKGRRLTEERLWNGEYFEQEGRFTEASDPRYQHGKGCLSDSLFGQLCATVAGLGHLVDEEKIRAGLRAIFQYNFRDPLGPHENLQRVYAWPDESGLLLCSWPRGEMPFYPFVYSDEVWSGIEYQVATHLAYEGQVDAALEILRAIRDRHDGRRRNPFNEYECGSHYARALASYGVHLALTGCRYDAVARRLTFAKRPFQAFWSVPGAWGTATRAQDGSLEVEVLGGALPEGTEFV